MRNPADTPNPSARPQVYVLIATYNGSAFIEQQIASIRAQSFADWRLLIRDDGSTDRTRELLTGFAAQDARIELVEDSPEQNLGPRGNFGVLMQRALEAGARYACFCDQDDVWHPEKIARQIATARKLEAQHGEHHPILVYTDLELIDSHLRLISPSFYGFQGIRRGHAEPAFSTLLVQNHVVGCTAMLNKALLELASPIPEEAYMHDWWAALCAGACGSLSFLPQALVRYRQHRANQIGAGGLRRLAKLSNWRPALHKMNRIFEQSVAQATALGSRLANGRSGPFQSCLSRPQPLAAINAWSHLGTTSLPGRLQMALRQRLVSQNLPLTVLMYAQLLCAPRLLQRRPGPSRLP